MCVGFTRANVEAPPHLFVCRLDLPVLFGCYSAHGLLHITGCVNTTCSKRTDEPLQQGRNRSPWLVHFNVTLLSDRATSPPVYEYLSHELSMKGVQPSELLLGA